MYVPRNERSRWNAAVTDSARDDLKTAIAAWYGSAALSRDTFPRRSWTRPPVTRPSTCFAARLQAETLDVVRRLLARGLLAGNLTKDGGFKAWSEQKPTEVIDRIPREWAALGESPSIDDIAWFQLPSSAEIGKTP